MFTTEKASQRIVENSIFVIVNNSTLASFCNLQEFIYLSNKTDNIMKKKIFDIIVIVVIALFLLTLSEFDLLEKSAKFMFIPILAFYFIGQWTERKSKKE